MAIGKFEFHSEALCGLTTFLVILPNDTPQIIREGNANYNRPAKTLFLLHGYTGSCSDWLYASLIQELAGKYNLAVVCPFAGNSFYLDGPETGRKYATYVGSELVAYVRDTFGIASCRADTMIGGLSMGGFGSIHTGLAYPHTFAKLFAFSSALILREVAGMKPGYSNPAANYEYYRMVFGAPERLLESENNPEEQIRRLVKMGEEIPEIFMACGTEDPLLGENRRFHQFIEEQGIRNEYFEGQGKHDWYFWNQCLEPAIQWMLKEC